MRFSQSVDMALHALWYMAKHSPEEPVQIKDLARCVRVSESYLARVMHWLAKAGLLKSIRGKNGGFTFKRPPAQITIADVVIAIDSDAAQFDCSWEERGCELHAGCSLVNLFHEAQKRMLEVLEQMTIADIAALESGAQQRSKWLAPEDQGLKVLPSACPSAPKSCIA
ncbi:MAG: Rrf2 family transcriptional regulator [bacterium]|nr:Rrf2 family transcriptional regulator [bacterium]